MVAAMAAIVIGALFLRVYGLPDATLTSTEADAIEAYAPGVPSGWHATVPDLLRPAPLATFAMRAARLAGPDSLPIKVCMVALGLWCVWLLAAIARRNGPPAMLLAAALAATSVLWVESARLVLPVLLVLWATVLLQYCFGLLWPRPYFAGALAYPAALLCAAAISPLLSVVGCIHVLWLLALLPFVAGSEKRRDGIVVLLAGSVLAVAVLALSFWLARPSAEFGPGLLTSYTWWQSQARLVARTLGDTLGLYVAEPTAGHKFRTVAVIVAGTLVLVGIVASALTRRARTVVWATVLVLFVPLWVIVAGVSPAKASHFDTVILWPYVVLLVAQGLATCQELAAKLYARVRVRAGRALLLCAGGLLAFTVAAAWVYLQYTAYAAMRARHSVQDLGAVVRFLEAQSAPTDRIVAVSDSDLALRPRYAYYVAPYLDRTPLPVTRLTHNEWRQTYGRPENTDGGLWVLGAPVNTAQMAARGYASELYRFAQPLYYVTRTNAHQQLDHLRRAERARALSPANPYLYESVLDWYRTAPDDALRRALRAGLACADLGTEPSTEQLRLKRHAAANRVLYAWSDVNVTNYDRYDFRRYRDYVLAAHSAGLDPQRTVYLLRLQAQAALNRSDPDTVAQTVAAARAWDADNPFVDRLDAQGALMETPPRFDEARELNIRAAQEYQARFDDLFPDALLANVLLEMARSNFPAALADAHALLDELQTRGRYRARNGQPVPSFWIGQCNSYIARLLCITGNYAEAIVWQRKNLDPEYGEKRNRVARQRLAELYIMCGEQLMALQQYEELGNMATSTAARVHWLLEAAQLNVSAGDAVAAYEVWQRINALVATLPAGERHDWSRDKRYQRVLQHVQSRMNVDVRDAVLVALEERSARAPELAGRYRQQIAHIYRCRLQYDMAAQAFADAAAAQPPSLDACLDAAMMYYQLERYDAARRALSNMLARAEFQAQPGQFEDDWRFRLLSEFRRLGKPPPMDAVLAWPDEHRNDYASPAGYHSYRGNVLSVYDDIAAASNEFLLGIAADPGMVDNYLDLGYLLCTQADRQGVERLLDALLALELDPERQRKLASDWRYIEMHHVANRPFTLEE
jgi:tetratricopeptide (TPR) repeat protein